MFYILFKIIIKLLKRKYKHNVYCYILITILNIQISYTVTTLIDYTLLINFDKILVIPA